VTKNLYKNSIGSATIHDLRLECLKLNEAIGTAIHNALDSGECHTGDTKRKKWFNTLCVASQAREVAPDACIVIPEAEHYRLVKAHNAVNAIVFAYLLNMAEQDLIKAENTHSRKRQ